MKTAEIEDRKTLPYWPWSYLCAALFGGVEAVFGSTNDPDAIFCLTFWFGLAVVGHLWDIHKRRRAERRRLAREG